MRYVFDLDGTLCTMVKGMDYEKAQPLPERIAVVNRLYDAGHHIIIDTARGSGCHCDWTERTALQLLRWGVKYHDLRCGMKPYADFYVDDRGVSDAVFFEGFGDNVGTFEEEIERETNDFSNTLAKAIHRWRKALTSDGGMEDWS